MKKSIFYEPSDYVAYLSKGRRLLELGRRMGLFLKWKLRGGHEPLPNFYLIVDPMFKALQIAWRVRQPRPMTGRNYIPWKESESDLAQSRFNKVTR